MQHTLVAVFDNRTDAQNAMNELLSSSFTREEVRLSNADPTGMTDSVTGQGDSRTSEPGESIGASIKHFFHDLFGADHGERVSRYEGAVTRGHHVLTVSAGSLTEVERAADIVERYGPTDIDEQASGEGATGAGAMSAGSMGMGATPESMRMSGAGGMQSARPAAQSAQSDSVLSQQLDNPGDRKLFAQQSLNQAEPMGQTYQEPMGKSGLSATGGTSFQGSTLQENSVQGSSLDGTQGTDASFDSSAQQGGTIRGSSLEGSAYQGGAPGAQQRDARMDSGLGNAMRSVEIQRGKSRIYSPDPGVGSGSSPSLDIGSTFGDDDGYYRNHFLANYSSGDDYDSYRPAYSYGSDMARDTRYSGRKWDEVEPELRSSWDTRSSGSAGATWDKMKAAVRRGWDRIASDDDDTQYRSHYDTHLSSTGEDYDSYKPAYDYGSEMRKSQMYRNQPWDDIEGDMRRGWDSRIAVGTGTGSAAGGSEGVGGAWDKMKSAVRHGWDSITGGHDTTADRLDLDDDDTAYRSHWNATYSTATQGSTYDEYKPAYSYGSEMARSEKYRGRQWNEIENDLRSDWDMRYGRGGQSTWETMKLAVRHGWDRMTS
ncbi:hypothetical protein [Telluria aromaticivorans]|uniref:Uncharacterized protein n=1 Tax=Telluria aromaticivorans TaxID=2725995 RepID=A0A7Y2JV10_9BURK|nr:hypothetical protein [Telluria aromaticivorans]NNG21496.1 hypothetical protein [Telluria aromaticivorans]